MSLFSYILYFIYLEETEVVLRFDGDCFAPGKRFFCSKKEVALQINGGSFF